MNDGILTPDKEYEALPTCGLWNQPMENHGIKKKPLGMYSKSFRDVYWYECPNYEEEWHDVLRRLYNEQKDSASMIIRTLIKKEMEFIVSHKRLLNELDIQDLPG